MSAGKPANPSTNVTAGLGSGQSECFWALVEEAARRDPNAILLADDGGRRLSATELVEQAERAAAGLLGHGVQPGDTVSWQLPSTLEAAVLMVALARLGAVQNPIIPAFRERELRFIVDQLAPSLAVVPDRWRGYEHAAVLRSFGAQVISLGLEGDWPDNQLRLPSGDPSTLPPPPTQGDMCRWIYYSSGTTGDPKGTRHTDSSVIASSNGVVDGLGMCAGDVYPIAWPLAHIGGIAMLSASLRAGGRLVLFDSFDPVVTPERMAEHGPTILGSATPFFRGYVSAQRLHGDRPLFPMLRMCVGGGAPTPEQVNREVSEVLGVPGVAGSWGLTEFPVATSESPDDPTVGSSVGRPVAGVEVRVVSGELWLRGPQRFLGYVDRTLDAEAFDSDGWFRTGDLGSVDAEGRVHIEGRSKDIIIRNAENVSALEVEDVISRHPAVVDGAVVGMPDPRTGERVCAVLVLRSGYRITLPELVDYCSSVAGLARYKCPEQLVVVDQLPRNSMGKVLKETLRSEIALR